MLRDAGDTYRAYLLRVWRVRADQGLSWRAMLERIPAGERRAFANVDALLAYLREEMTERPQSEGAEEEET